MHGNRAAEVTGQKDRTEDSRPGDRVEDCRDQCQYAKRASKISGDAKCCVGVDDDLERHELHASVDHQEQYDKSAQRTARPQAVAGNRIVAAQTRACLAPAIFVRSFL